MARIRSIKPGFFTSDRLAEFSPLTRILFAGLWTIADREGRLEDRPKKIKVEVLPYDDGDVDAMLGELAAGDDPFISRYVVDGVGVIQISKFLEHQKPHPKEAPSALPEQPSREITRLDNTQPRKGHDEPGGLGVSFPLVSGLGSGDGAMPPKARPMARGGGPTGLISGVHPRCDSATWGACAKGVCVPPFLVQEWRTQLASDPNQSAYLTAFVDGVAATLTGPVGDSPANFWRKQWAAKHGVMAYPQADRPTKGDQMRENAKQALAILESRQADGIDRGY